MILCIRHFLKKWKNILEIKNNFRKIGAVDLLSLNLNQTTISSSKYNKSLLAMTHNFLLTYHTEYWEEQLTLVASAMNDEKENQLISARLAMIFNNEQSAPSISKEKLEAEINNLAIAYQVMQNESKKNQSLKWQWI